jgi:hypothetical protein
MRLSRRMRKHKNESSDMHYGTMRYRTPVGRYITISPRCNPSKNANQQERQVVQSSIQRLCQFATLLSGRNKTT